jgi:hypothetical protein
VNGSVAAWPVAASTPWVSPAVAPPLSPCAGFEPGPACDGSCAGIAAVVVVTDAVVVVDVVVVVTTGGPGFGCG